MDGARIHPSADVDERVEVGPGTTVWHLAQIRENARPGGDCIVGRGAYVRARRDHRRPGETAERRPGVRAGPARGRGVHRGRRGAHERCLPRYTEAGGALSLVASPGGQGG